MRRYALAVLAAHVLFFSPAASAGEPLDLFPNRPDLGDGFVRIATWNLRHINLESGAQAFLPGANNDEDFDIRVGTFAKGIQDLKLDVVAVVEVQPRSREPNRLLQIRDKLNGMSGTWFSDETDIVPSNETLAGFPDVAG